ncbi:glycerol-3-phosphate dehydrogenase [Octadecabacter sp. 1_MG-2023]|uniref:glycerol-3-phosphate dehydrogenase n=1 Tax=unclassified Octadecabacter TaxID=196158 RepID=UPI001C09CB57|nr:MULTISPECIES: glycerol-3-phosphate dehydrogenase [unclassified Octadecabacter]MBU2994613.1 glycerol-3-phosphate dehydrogenase [Octadecabacter sp. B2R22]MDO6734094.1 glycerol-3-phosphate dehydrogenase [Octadecabacter sp. 1_MG-2023]
MPDTNNTLPTYDLFVIGGGINGCGVARDAAGRGLSVGLAEMNDLASATSSASTKLFHGGLRYLEFFEFGLVAKALKERETLLKAMPHISWPMRFVLPVHKDMRFESETPTSKLLNTFMPWMKGRRPAWLIRFGLFLYDTLGGRQILPGTSSINLRSDATGLPLQDKFEKAYEYSDCWIEDSRLVVLNARDAEARGAKIMTRTEVITADRVDGLWKISLLDHQTGNTFEVTAKALVNASGPWVGDVIDQSLDITSSEGVRLVRGSHIVTKRLFDHDKAYFFQGEDGRIIFAIPYETDFTLIGTTDAEHGSAFDEPDCTDEEADYLCAFASNYFKKPITRNDIVWSYSGVRPLYDDGAKSATAATRDYVLSLNDADGGAPVVNVFGGKITTFRKLAENVLSKFEPYFPQATKDWTAGVPLPGGDFPVDGVETLITALRTEYPFLDAAWAQRLIKAYGTDARVMLGNATSAADLGELFGATLTEREVLWLMDREYAQQAVDVVWRRTRLGLRMTSDQIENLDQWMKLNKNA